MINDGLIDAIVKHREETFNRSLVEIDEIEANKVRLSKYYEELKFILSQIYTSDKFIARIGKIDIWWNSKKEDIELVETESVSYKPYNIDLKCTKNILRRFFNRIRISLDAEWKQVVSMVASVFFALGLISLIGRGFVTGNMLVGIGSLLSFIFYLGIVYNVISLTGIFSVSSVKELLDSKENHDYLEKIFIITGITLPTDIQCNSIFMKEFLLYCNQKSGRIYTSNDIDYYTITSFISSKRKCIA